MADKDQGDRTEAPTPRKREESRKKGQVPRTQEAGAAVGLIASGLLLQGGGGGLGGAFTELFGNSVRLMSTPAGPAGAPAFLEGVGWTMLGAMLPVLATLAGAALFVGAVQGRGVLTLEPLKPKPEKLSVVKNAGKIWGAKAPAELAKNLMKLGIVVGSMYMVLGGALDEVRSLSQQSPLALLFLIQRYGARVLLAAGVAFLGLALADYGFQVWQTEKQLKMSRQEIKEEQKDTDGDPHVKARRRSQQSALARRRMMLSVSEADVVVTNPTHVAVALCYDPDRFEAPVVLAMGERKVAQRIKKLAREAGVPTLENKPLARALLASAEVGAPIPVELYVAVAKVLAWVFKQRGGAYGPGGES